MMLRMFHLAAARRSSAISIRIDLVGDRAEEVAQFGLEVVDVCRVRATASRR